MHINADPVMNGGVINTLWLVNRTETSLWSVLTGYNHMQDTPNANLAVSHFYLFISVREGRVL